MQLTLPLLLFRSYIKKHHSNLYLLSQILCQYHATFKFNLIHCLHLSLLWYGSLCFFRSLKYCQKIFFPHKINQRCLAISPCQKTIQLFQCIRNDFLPCPHLMPCIHETRHSAFLICLPAQLRQIPQYLLHGSLLRVFWVHVFPMNRIRDFLFPCQEAFP